MSTRLEKARAALAAYQPTRGDMVDRLILANLETDVRFAEHAAARIADPRHPLERMFERAIASGQPVTIINGSKVQYFNRERIA